MAYRSKKVGQRRRLELLCDTKQGRQNLNKETQSVYSAETLSVLAIWLAYGTKHPDVRTMTKSDKAMNK